MPEIALLNNRREVQLAPFNGIQISVIVAGLKLVVAVEGKLPHVLAHRIAPDAAAGSIGDVVVDFAVVYEGSSPEIFRAGVLAVPRGILNIGLLADEDVIRHRVHQRAAVGHGVGDAGLGGAGPGGGAVVNEVGEIGLLIIRVRRGDRCAKRIGGADAIANQSAIHLKTGGHDCCVNAIAGGDVAVSAVIEHGERCPGGVVSGIGDGDVAAGIDELILQSGALHALRIGDFGSDGDGDVGRGRFGEIVHLPHRRRSIVRLDGRIGCAGRNVLRGNQPDAAEAVPPLRSARVHQSIAAGDNDRVDARRGVHRRHQGQQRTDREPQYVRGRA